MNGVIGVAITGNFLKPFTTGKMDNLDVTTPACFPVKNKICRKGKTSFTGKTNIVIMPCIIMNKKTITGLRKQMHEYVDLICNNVEKHGHFNI